MAAGEGQRHANELGWRGNPGRGRGPQKRHWAFWKRLEVGAWTLLHRGRAGSALLLLPPSAVPVPAGKNTHTRATSRPCFAISVPPWQQKQNERKVRLPYALPPAPAPWRPDHPAPPLEGQVLTKLCRCCQVSTCPCVCISLGSALKSEVVILYHPRGALKEDGRSALDLAESFYSKKKISKGQLKHLKNLCKAALSGVGVNSVLQ